MPDQRFTVESTAERAARKCGTTASRVFFNLGSSAFSLDASSVSEIIHPLPITPLPNCPDSIEGVAPLRGELIAVINISSIMGLTESHDAEPFKWIVLAAAAGSTKFAFPVGKMVEIAAHEDAPKSEDSSEKGLRLSGSRSDTPMLDITSVISKIELALR